MNQSDNKVEPSPAKPISASSYLRKRYKAIMSKKQSLDKDDASDIKAKYAEKKPMSFREYANKIKAKYQQPKPPSDEERISQIKDQYRQQEQAKIDAPVKENTAATKRSGKLALSESEES